MLKWIDLPPVWLIAAGALMERLAARAPWPAFDHPILQAMGGLAILVALCVMLWAASRFRAARTTIIPHQAPSRMVTDGPFRISRNPIYAADVLILLGWAAMLGAALPLVVIPVFMWIIQRRFIEPEEARLREAFGHTYDMWAGHVGRWI